MPKTILALIAMLSLAGCGRAASSTERAGGENARLGSEEWLLNEPLGNWLSATDKVRHAAVETALRRKHPEWSDQTLSANANFICAFVDQLSVMRSNEQVIQIIGEYEFGFAQDLKPVK